LTTIFSASGARPGSTACNRRTAPGPAPHNEEQAPADSVSGSR
jgi:hypothetical protein